MDELMNASHYHDQAERMRALAVKEQDRKRRQVMFAIAEHYYLLHDEFEQLGRLQPQPPRRLAEGLGTV